MSGPPEVDEGVCGPVSSRILRETPEMSRSREWENNLLDIAKLGEMDECLTLQSALAF